ncbi:hypothetical protein D3C71_1851510 [compost metagenome]
MVLISVASWVSLPMSTLVLTGSDSLPDRYLDQSTYILLVAGVFSTLASSVVTSPESSLLR